MITAEASVVAHCLADAEHRIVWCDDAYTELLRRDRQEIIGKHPLDFTHALDRGLNATMLGRLASEGTAFSITKRYLRGDGALIWVSNTVAPAHDGHGPRPVCVTCRPVADPVNTSALARNMRAARQLCTAFIIGKELFGADLITAPAAETLLLLYTAEIEGTHPTGYDLARSLDVGAAPMIRWLKLLLQRGLIEVERGESVSLAASFRLAKGCEQALDALIVTTGL
jgi:PAS domain S-box-containing protein